MKYRLGLGLLALSTTLLSQGAGADVYKCVDGAGHITYSNLNNRGCKKVNLGPESTAPTTRPRASASETPASFPRVSNDQQKTRDNDRQRILEQELASEQRSLERARKELAEQEAIRNGDERNYARVQERLLPYQDRVAQHERNIQAINRELSVLK